MKRGKRLILPLLGTLILTSLFSCGVDRWPEYYPETGRDIWIDSVMRQEYLWYRDMLFSETGSVSEKSRRFHG